MQRVICSALTATVLACATVPPPPSTPAPSLAAAPLDTSALGEWRYSEYTDPLTNKSDQRLVLVTRDSVRDRTGNAATPRLIVSCGTVYPGPASGQRLVIDLGLEPRVDLPNPLGNKTQISHRADARAKPTIRHELIVPQQRTHFYLGEFNNFMFDNGLFSALLRSNTFVLRVSPAEGTADQTVTFDVRGLRESIRQLNRCHWPA